LYVEGKFTQIFIADKFVDKNIGLLAIPHEFNVLLDKQAVVFAKTQILFY
jgi:hypothetical protein